MDAPIVVDPRRRGGAAAENTNESILTLLTISILYFAIVLSASSSTDPTIIKLLEPFVGKLAGLIVDIMLPYITWFCRLIHQQVQRVLVIFGLNNPAPPELPITNATHHNHHHHHHTPQLEDAAQPQYPILNADQHTPQTSPASLGPVLQDNTGAADRN